MVSLNRRRPLVGLLFCVAVAAMLPLLPLRGHAQTSTPLSETNQQATVTSQQASATVARSCETCHSARIQTAGLVLDQEAIDQVPANAERWEKVIRKLEARSMPPPGAPRPDAATYDALKGYLETRLDRAAAAAPNAGKRRCCIALPAPSIRMPCAICWRSARCPRRWNIRCCCRRTTP